MNIMSDKINKEEFYQPVAEFYEDKSVFITGATGFLGKVLLERLLWNCPKIDKVYVLVREKKGVSVDRRIEELLDNVLFAKLKDNRPDDLKKIIPIPGDIGVNNLGMNNVDENTLIEKVAIVIHTAATIMFNEPLEEALKINLQGTNQILDLCHRMKKLEVFVHTSTAYTNTDKKVIEEIVYPPPANLSDVYLQLEQNLDEDFTKVLNGQPNTYTFTKALTENLIMDRNRNLTTILIRPSIVTAVANEPLPGWIDNWYGASATLSSISKGINRILWGNVDNIVDLIPVDYVANFFLIAIAKGQRSESVVVYNCCSSFSNPIRYRGLFRAFVDDAIKHRNYIYPFPQIYFMTTNKIIESIVKIFLEILPAFIADCVGWLFNKPTGFLKLQKRIVAKREVIKFFTTNSWMMHDLGARALYTSLSTSDQNQFPCDVTQLNWDEYILTYSAGIRKHLENK